MYCRKCGTENEEDALFCKQCGASLIEQYEKEPIEKRKTQQQKPKVKKKTKVKNKVKRPKKKQPKKSPKKEVVVERKMGLFSKIIMFFLVILVIALAAVSCLFGYKIYSDANIEVPDVTKMTYEEAEFILKEKNLNIAKKEKIIEEEEQEGIVLEQNKKPGKKVSKNAVIKVTVGVLDDSVVVPNVVGMSIDQGKNELNHLKISYSISYKEIEDGEENIILSQTPKKGSKIKKQEKVLLVVSQKKETSPELPEEDSEEELEDEDLE